MTVRKVDGKIASEVEANIQTQLAFEEIMELGGQGHNFNYEKVLIEKDGKMIEVEVPIDDIDLLDDFDDEDLTEEGMRSLGLINKDFDTTTNTELESKTRNKLPQVIVSIDESKTEDEIQITCPYTGSTEVYQIDSETWASYDTDQPFTVVFQSSNSD